MKKQDQAYHIDKANGELQKTLKSRSRQRQADKSEKKKSIKFLSGKYIDKDEYDIYEGAQKTPELQEQDSSFQLDSEDLSGKAEEKDTIDKVLLKLGLNRKIAQKQNEELKQVVNNIIENCIGTVDDEQNLATYKAIYGEEYEQLVKQKPFSGSIIISELTDLEKIRKIPNSGIMGVYKYIRLFSKKVSMVCESIVEHTLFESFILLIIVLNSLKMALDDPLSTQTGTTTIEDIFTALYTMEMLIKIVAYGFLFAPKAYLRDAWNMLDFVIVATSLMPLVIDINFSVNSLRAIRVLRPLKTITKVKALKMIVSTLFFSFSLVMDSLYILIFVMIVFSIAGTQLFSGLLQNRCMELATGTLTETICIKGGECSEEGFLCAKGIESPNFSITNFDTFFWSMLSVFRSLTMEGWSDIMIGLQQAYSSFSFIYSVMIVFFCEYVLLNMTLAILKYKYSQVKGNTIEEEEEETNEYEPAFLKKIGIYDQVSRLVYDAPLRRYGTDSTKIFVGCTKSFNGSTGQEDEGETQPINFQLTMQHFENSKTENRKSVVGSKNKAKIDIEELKNLGRVQEAKWDAKALDFESMELEGVAQNRNPKTEEQSEKNIKERNEESEESMESFSDDSDDSEVNLYDGNSSSSGDDDYEGVDLNKKKGNTSKLYEAQKKLGTSSKNIGTSNYIRSNKMLPELKQAPVPKAEVIHQNQEALQLDNMLRLISEPQQHSHCSSQKYMIQLPEIDFDQIEPERLFRRFDDLGDFRIKRVNRTNELNYFNIKHNKKRVLPLHAPGEKKSHNLVQELNEENELDLKELQLVNELSKKQLKCRLKDKAVLNEYKSAFSYDITRVMVSQKVKEVEKKKEELIENMNSLRFQVKYVPGASELTDDSTSKAFDEETLNSSIYRRNLNQRLEGLKLPEMIKEQSVRLSKASSEKSIRNETNNTYLKLLQSHQMEEKIELVEDRIMQTFFKREGNRPSNPRGEDGEESVSLIEEYNQTKEEDIFNRHGRIVLESPVQSLSSDNEGLFDKINIKDEEYEVYVTGFFGVLNVVRKKTLLFITRPIYDNTMLLLVILNTVLLSMNGLVDTDESPYADINTFFTFAFTVDLVLKVFAFGTEFFGDVMNLFDAFVVSISLVELSFGGGGGSNLSALRAVRILRAFRVLRITRLIRTLNYMKIVMSVVSSVITEFVYIFMLLSLFIFIYTLLGMQIFGGQILPQSVTGIRQSFDTFFDSFFSVFQVLTVENWNDIETIILTSQTGVWSVVYLVSWIFIGNWILLNLMQAILLDGFDKDSDIFNNQEEGQEAPAAQEAAPEEPEKAEGEDDTENCSIESKQAAKYSSSDASLFIFLPDSPVRLISLQISNSKIFENFIVLMIGLSSLKLVVDTYLQEGSEMYEISDKMDLFFNFVFIFESVVKIISQGFVVGEKAYLKSSWSKLDFFIVMTAVIDMSLGIDLSILKLFRTLRPLRIISRNPDMKIIISSLGESMLGILNVLIIILCVFLMIGILGINLLQDKLNFCNESAQLDHNFYGPYGVTQEMCEAGGGVWSTQFVNFDNIGSALLSLYVFSTRENWPYYSYTFMDAGEESPEENTSQVIFMVFTVVIIFVCSYFFMDLLVGVLFMNFHEAEAKIRPKRLTDRQINWKNLQKIIIEEDPCFKLYLEPAHKFNRFFYGIVNFRYFDIFVTACILGNIVVMMVATNDQTQATESTLDTINFAFSVIFICEFALKFAAFGRAYFLSGWNVFDFFVVMASILDIILEYSGSKSDSSSALSILPQIARIFRVLRVTKLLRMFKRFKGLQKLIETFIFSLPALAKGLSIVCLFLFISSVLASYLFGGIAGDYSGNFDEIRNFSNFHSSFELLFIITTGENWYFYMYESMLPGYVQCAGGGSECTQGYYLVFWLVYVFFSQKVFMELFVLIVLDQFEANYINENNPLGIFSLFEDDFRAKWIDMTAKYHSQKIESKRLLQLLLVLKQPLGLGKNELMAKYEEELRESDKITEEEIHQNLAELDVKLKKSAAKLLNKMTVIKNRMYLGYHETFYHFAKLSLVSDFIDDATDEQKLALELMHKESEEALESLKPQGNLYYYMEESSEGGSNKSLNPIELILFSQMIIKSWHNYSLKYHMDAKGRKVPKAEENSLYHSLNNSCASDIEEADLEKLQNDRRFIKRKGLLERRDLDQTKHHIQMMPNIEEHYSNDRRKNLAKSKTSTRKKTSLQRSSLRRSGARQESGVTIRINSQESD